MRILLRDPKKTRPKNTQKTRKSRRKKRNSVGLLSKIERSVLVNAFCLANGVICARMPIIPEGKFELINPFIRSNRSHRARGLLRNGMAAPDGGTR